MSYCDKFSQSFSSYIEGELSSENRKILESHLSICPACQDTIHRIRSVRHTLNTLPRVSTSSEFEYRLNQRIRSSKQQRSGRSPINQLFPWKIPAIGFVVILMAFSYFVFFEADTQEVDLKAPQESSFTPKISGQDAESTTTVKSNNISGPVGVKDAIQDSTDDEKAKEALKKNIKLVNDKTKDN